MGVPRRQDRARRNPEAAVVRELDEELAIDVTPTARLQSLTHDYADARVRLTPVLCHHAGRDPQPIQVAAWRWVLAQDLTNHPFLPATAALIATLDPAALQSPPASATFPFASGD